MASIAEIGVLSILSVFFLIHLAVLLKWIPYTLVWGSRLKTDKEMYRFEIVSLLLISIFLWVALERSNVVSGFLSDSILEIMYGIMALLFALNTLGNLVSKNRVEKWIFTPLAFLLTIFCLIIALT